MSNIIGAQFQEGVDGSKPSTCFSSSDCSPPYTDNPNSFCQKNVSESYGFCAAYNVQQNTATYDPLINENFVRPGRVESFQVGLMPPHFPTPFKPKGSIPPQMAPLMAPQGVSEIDEGFATLGEYYPRNRTTPPAIQSTLPYQFGF